MDFLTTLLLFVIVIGILVAIHEFGHFIAARMTGMRVDVFAIGMGKRLFGYNKITGFTWGDLPEDWDGNGYTDYRISMLPIGGYVKIAGMVDESFDTNYTATEAKPWEFRSKNAWQKAIVITAGVIMNILLAYGIYSGLAFVNGETIFNTTTIGYTDKESPFAAAGLRSGDRIISVDNQPVSNWKQIIKNLTTEQVGDDKVIVVRRDTATMAMNVSGKKIVDALTVGEQKSLGIYPDGLRVLVQKTESGFPAAKAGIQAGDTIVAVEGIPIVSPGQLTEIVRARKDASISVRWKRGNDIRSAVVRTTGEGAIGIHMGAKYIGSQSQVDYSIGEALAVGYRDTKNSATAFFDMMGQIFSGKVPFKQAIGGPVKIAEMASETFSFGIATFLIFMANLSITLAVINIMPFPALDGGHLVFIILEGIARREVPVKVKLAFQQAGVIILLGFMIFVLYNDIVR